MQCERHLQYNLNTETFSLYFSEMCRRFCFFPAQADSWCSDPAAQGFRKLLEKHSAIDHTYCCPCSMILGPELLSGRWFEFYTHSGLQALCHYRASSGCPPLRLALSNEHRSSVGSSRLSGHVSVFWRTYLAQLLAAAALNTKIG